MRRARSGRVSNDELKNSISATAAKDADFKEELWSRFSGGAGVAELPHNATPASSCSSLLISVLCRQHGKAAPQGPGPLQGACTVPL